MTQQSYNNYVANLTYYHSVLGESVANSIKLGKCDVCKLSMDLMISDAMITVLSQYVLPAATSTVTGQVLYSDWYLPTNDELNYMYNSLHLAGLGNFQADYYWSSSERIASTAWALTFATGNVVGSPKGNTLYVRPCRSYQSSTTYYVGGFGEGGGYIYYVDSSTMPYTYYECALADIAGTSAWSNITTLSVGTTSTVIGTGLANSQLIVAQTGHVSSAALSCLTYSVNGYGIVGTTVGVNPNPLTVEEMQAITAMLNKIHGTNYCVDFILT